MAGEIYNKYEWTKRAKFIPPEVSQQELRVEKKTYTFSIF